MKKEKCWKSLHGCLCAAVLALFTFGFTSCKDDDLKGGFDPSKPIVVTDFMPKEAGYGNNLMVYGNNFGNDVSKISVTVGGKQANVISVKNDALYCVVRGRMEMKWKSQLVMMKVKKLLMLWQRPSLRTKNSGW